jgi:peptide/nickel transport system permease protein
MTVAEGPFETQATADERPAWTPTQMAWRRFRRHKMAMFGVCLLIGIILYVIVGAFFLSEEYANRNDLSIKLSPPSQGHPFGTDGTGRDILARTIYGGQISIIIGLCAVVISVGVGVLVGAIAGYYGGLIDAILMRFTEAMFNIPQLFLLIVALKEWEFVTAARCVGVKDFGLIFRHILPNSIAPIVVSATLGVASAILNEAYISFLGLGVQAPTATWGNMLDQAYHHLDTEPWMWFFPGMLILLTVLSINFLGDGLRDALDPRTVI